MIGNSINTSAADGGHTLSDQETYEVRCTLCKGSGRIGNQRLFNCPRCNGSGKVVMTMEILPNLYHVDLSVLLELMEDKFGKCLEDWPDDNNSFEVCSLSNEIIQFAGELTKGSIVGIRIEVSQGIQTSYDPYGGETLYVLFTTYNGDQLTNETYIFHADEDGPFGQVLIYSKQEIDNRAEWRYERQEEEKRKKEDDAHV